MFYAERRKSKFIKRFLAIYILVVVIGLSFVGGLYVGGRGLVSLPANGEKGGELANKNALPPFLLQDVDFNLLWDVWNMVKDRYVEQPVLDTKLFYGAMSGIVASLGDPYSVFLDPELSQKFSSELAGTFDGIGAEIGIKSEQLVIIAPLPDTPAQKAGLLPGDKIIRIDKKDTLNMPLDIAVSNIRGQKGTAVNLEILRNGWKETKTFSITRDTINVQSVTSKMLNNDIGYIKIAYFNETAPDLFERAVQDTLAKNPKGLVLDLRNNPGGFLEVGVRVASEWLDQGATVVFQEFQNGKREPFKSGGYGRFKGLPTIALVNQGSASASEIVAGTLQDYKVATLVGEKTFGKGSVQTFEQLRGGSALKLTIAHWLTPNGRQIEKQGIAPDVEVKMGKDDFDKDKDPQIEKALDILTKT